MGRLGEEEIISQYSFGGGNGNPLQYSCLMPGKSHGQRILVGYSLWGLKDLDTT